MTTEITKRAYLQMLAGETAARLGENIASVQQSKAASEGLGADFKRVVALIADASMCKVGGMGTAPQLLARQLWTASEWHPAFDALVEPFSVTLGCVKKAAGAGGLASLPFRLVGSTSKSLTDILGQLFLLSTVAGASGGAINWHLKRQLAQDDGPNEELSAQANLYDEMRKDVEAENRLKPIKAL